MYKNVRDTSPGLLSRIVRKATDQTSGCPDFLDAVDERYLLVSEATVRERDRRPGAVRCLLRKVQPSAGFIFGAGASPLIGTRAPGRTIPAHPVGLSLVE